MGFSTYKLVAFVGMISVSAMSVAQDVAPLSKHSAHVKGSAEKLLSGSVVSVFLLDGEEKDCEFLSAHATTLVLYDEATHSELVVNYDNVRTIKQGTPKSRRWHAAAVVVPIALAVIFIVSYIFTNK